MASVPYKFTTTASTNLQLVRAGQTANFKGIVAQCVAAYDIFLKLYWFTPTASATAPVVGTTIPQLTIAIASSNLQTPDANFSWPDGITGNGQLWVAVTKVASDTDTTAVAAGDGIITLLVE
jgi:hypothetical protein